MKMIKKLARKVLFPFAISIKADRVILLFARKKIIHVMYHGVVDVPLFNFSGRHIALEQFEKQMMYFKKHFNIISTSQAFESIPSSSKKLSIAISFDDGFVNNLDFALPVLERLNIPATFCISTCALDGENALWAEKIAAFNYFYPSVSFSLNDHAFTGPKRNSDGMYISEYFKTLSKSERDQCLRTLERRFNLREKLNEIESKYWRLMNKDELLKFVESPVVELGSHAHMHYNLANLTAEEARGDLKYSKDLLENTIGKSITLLAYPDGSYDRNVVDIAEEVGFTKQLAVNYKHNDDCEDPRLIDRFGISTTTTYESNILNLCRAFLGE